jgi:predicted dehydrogenase
MIQRKESRRRFLTTTSQAVATTIAAPYFITKPARAGEESKNDRPVLGCIGTGDRWSAVGPNAMKLSDCVAVCDVDAHHAAKAVVAVQKRQDYIPEVYEDYRRVLDRKDIDVVTIVTTDHWHSKIAIEAMQAGKDVYCEKPLTLTIEEGKQICQVARQTGRVFQVGTQQRSEMKQLFLQAIAMIRDGRIGQVKKVVCDIGGAPTCGSIPVVKVPSALNWDMWLGQAPVVDYRHQEGGIWGDSRCHFQFRWWYEYSGGKLTDWGAHHVDIGQWAIQQNGPGQGVVSVQPVLAAHPVDLRDGMPLQEDRYNTAHEFHVRCQFQNDVEMNIVSQSTDGNGIMFEGTKGRFHVSRGRIQGKPFEDLQQNPLPEDALVKAYRGKQPGGENAHMRNFFECIRSRDLPISDVFTHHRALTTCHLANIAMRLNRSIRWNAKTERIVGDQEADTWQRRTQRKGFEIHV